jgi:hypothetical protein
MIPHRSLLVARVVGDVVVLAIFVGVMLYQDAPSWAVTIALYVGTRVSSIELRLDRSALQSTLRNFSHPHHAEDDTPPTRARRLRDRG